MIRTAQIPDLQKIHGYDLSKYNLQNKRQVLRNCVAPELGKFILDCITGHKDDTPLSLFSEGV